MCVCVCVCWGEGGRVVVHLPGKLSSRVCFPQSGQARLLQCACSTNCAKYMQNINFFYVVFFSVSMVYKREMRG